MNDAPHAELARIRDLIKKEQYDEALQSVIGVQQSVEGSAGALAFWLRGLALTGLSQPDRAERSFRTAYSIVRYAPASDADAQRILGAAPLVADPAVQRRINLVGRWLASRTSRPDLPWTFGVIESDEVNAFAALRTRRGGEEIADQLKLTHWVSCSSAG